MNLDLLQTFVTFCEEKSVVKTAKKLGLTQPAVSQQLSKLDNSLPHALFAQVGRRKQLSVYGRALFNEVAPSISSLQRSVELVGDGYKDPSRITLRIGVRSELIPRISSMLNFPGRMIFTDASSDAAVSGILNNDFDVAVSRIKPDSSEIVSLPLFEGGTKLIWSFGSRSNRKPSITKLLNSRFVMYADPHPFLSEWLSHEKIDFDQLRLASVCEDWQAIVSLVSKGNAFSIVPENIKTDPSLVSQCSISPSIIKPTKFYLLYRRELRSIKNFRAYWN